ncbi:hypothetical protein BH09MYX1_BH09MYX1_00850 [soil metagenome]
MAAGFGSESRGETLANDARADYVDALPEGSFSGAGIALRLRREAQYGTHGDGGRGGHGPQDVPANQNVYSRSL